MFDQEPAPYCRVLINSEGQYGVWPLSALPPSGWRPTGYINRRPECLRHVLEISRPRRTSGVETAGHRPSTRAAGAAASQETLPTALDRLARRSPQAVCLTEGERRLTYEALAIHSDRLAAELLDRGVGLGSRVAVHHERGIDAAVVLLAVLKAGAAYLPMDFRDPDTWQDFVLGEVSLLVTSPRWRDRVKQRGQPTLTWPDTAGRAPWRPMPAGVASTGAACVLYRQSRGETLGVVVEHRQMLAAALDPSPLDLPPPRGSSIAALSDPVAHGELWRSLLHGARPPTLPDANPAQARRSTAALHGAAETAGAYALATGGGTEPLLVERPLRGYRLYALDAHGQPVQDGAAAELFVGGGGVARGYLGRADLTADRFLPDPFLGQGRRMYASRVPVRRRGDGELEYVVEPSVSGQWHRRYIE